MNFKFLIKLINTNSGSLYLKLFINAETIPINFGILI